MCCWSPGVFTTGVGAIQTETHLKDVNFHWEWEQSYNGVLYHQSVVTRAKTLLSGELTILTCFEERSELSKCWGDMEEGSHSLSGGTLRD